MEPTSLDLAKINLLSDLVKIGIPALVGLIAGLIPFFLEKTKINTFEAQEHKKYIQAKVTELIDSFSDYSGSYFRYLSFITTNAMRHEEIKVMTLKAAEDFLGNERKLKKALALSGLLGQHDLMECINEYSDLASKNLNELVKDPTRKETVKTDLVRVKEREVFLLLGQIVGNHSK